MKLERFEPRGRGPLALEPSAFGGLFPVVTAPTTEQLAGDVAVVSVRGRSCTTPTGGATATTA